MLPRMILSILDITMTTKLSVLIDIGGTAIKFGVASLDGKFIEKSELPTEALQFGGPGIVKKVRAIVQGALASYKSEIAYVAISTAGMVNPDTCDIIYALPSSIPDYTGVNFQRMIEEEFKLPCFVENDVNCAALGELWLGAGIGCHNVFCLTVGTSIGGAMIVDDTLVKGASFSAGEIAYMRVPGGVLHELATTTHLVKSYSKKAGLPLDKVNGVLIFDKAQAGDSIAISCIDELIDNLTDGITNIVSLQNPQMVILGGGIMARGDYLREKIEASLSSKLKDLVFKATKIEFARLQNDAGMLGALFNLKQKLKL